MNHHDAEMTDVVVVLDCKDPESVDAATKGLKELGLSVSDVNREAGVIEGSIESNHVPQLKNVPGVTYVRSIFSYTADFPVGDPRDKDLADDSDETEDD
jgi:hypothetical protein